MTHAGASRDSDSPPDPSEGSPQGDEDLQYSPNTEAGASPKKASRCRRGIVSLASPCVKLVIGTQQKRLQVGVCMALVIKNQPPRSCSSVSAQRPQSGS